MAKDKYIGPLVKKYGSCRIRLRKKSEYFEDLVDAIVQQQLSMKAAASIFNRIKEKISDKGDSKRPNRHRWRVEKTLNVKVTPDKILALTDKELRGCGLSFAKISYIKDLSQRVLDGRLEVDKLHRLVDEKVMQELVAVKGIGRWTAEMFLMFTLARPDIFPVDDMGIRKGIVKLRPAFAKASARQVERFAERWKPFRTIASWYLWRSLENK